MTSQTINIRGTVKDCWIINRVGSDVLPTLRQAVIDDWFDVMAKMWIAAYRDSSQCPQVPYQFVLRCQPIVC